MSDSKEPAHDAIEATIAERLTAFDRYRDALHTILQKVCDRKPKTKSFDPDKSWRRLRHMARIYLREEASVKQKQMQVPAADRRELLLQLEDTLEKARCKLDEARHHDIRRVLFVEWCEATYDNPDLTDPRIARDFNETVAGVVASLAALETTASRADSGRFYA